MLLSVQSYQPRATRRTTRRRIARCKIQVGTSLQRGPGTVALRCQDAGPARKLPQATPGATYRPLWWKRARNKSQNLAHGPSLNKKAAAPTSLPGLDWEAALID